MDDKTHVHDTVGIGLHAYFAAHAPAMPDWFSCVPKRPAPEMVNWRELLPAELHSQYIGLHDWLDESEVDARVVEVSNLNEARTKEYDQWMKECEIERFFAWPWYYADQMVRTAEHG